MSFRPGWSRWDTQFVRYLLAGGLAAVANYASRFLFSAWVPFEIAVAMAYSVGMWSGFLLMRRYAFRTGTKPAAAQAVSYVAVNVVAFAQTIVVSSALLRVAFPAFGIHDHAEAFAHAIGVAVPVVTSYFGHKLLTFR
jgi:putative flippase GtrA